MNRKSYPTDLNNTEWEFLEPYFIVSYAKGGRPPKYSKRELINAVLYILRTGCQWKCLPHDFPNWKTVYYQFTRWKKQNLLEHINHELITFIRISIGKDQPNVGIIDSQSVKKVEVRGIGGYDPVKKKSTAGKGIY